MDVTYLDVWQFNTYVMLVSIEGRIFISLTKENAVPKSKLDCIKPNIWYPVVYIDIDGVRTKEMENTLFF